MTDLDEVRNQVFVGVEAGAVANVRSELAARGLPADAYLIQIVQLTEPDASLNDAVRPTVAGLNLSGCTLGFNTQYNGAAALVTSSLCSNQPYGNLPDFNAAFPAGSGHRVGFEVMDQNLYTGYVYFSAAGRGYMCGGLGCRFSDSRITQYYGSIPATQGYIARTTTFSNTAAAGSITIDPNDPSLRIVNKLPYSFMTVGTPASKMGRIPAGPVGRSREPV